ncbi:MAG: hypothetical protein JRF33_12865 [Deltaproteobacteria bacterium]|nr:hypothetical protein [Deltaproteobacteria bacterium]
MKQIVFIGIIVALSFTSTMAWSKRTAPVPVNLVHEGVKYLALHFGDDNRKTIEARDAKSGKLLWNLAIYELQIDPDIERDKQEVFISSMKVQGGILLITNESKDHFKVDLKLKKVVSQGGFIREAYACSRNEDCITTCFQGAINGDWYKKNRLGLGSCKDGCSSKGTGPAQCIDSICVSFSQKGKRIDHCTKKMIWRRPRPITKTQ